MSERYVRRLYLDLLGRAPFPAERERALKLKPVDLVRLLVRHPDYHANWVRERMMEYQLYVEFTPNKRDPDFADIKALPERLAKGQITQKQAIRTLVLSSAWDRRNMNADNFVRAAFELLNGKIPAAQELRQGKAQYSPKPRREAFVDSLLAGRPFAEFTLRQLYLRLVQYYYRNPSRVAPQFNLEQDVLLYMKGEQHLGQILVSWLTGDEYMRRLEVLKPKAAHQWVGSLWADVLGRAPREDEVQTLVRSFGSFGDPTPMRLITARSLLRSKEAKVPNRTGDPAGWTVQTFQRLLGRTPTDAEMQAFTSSLSGKGSPVLALQALLASDEYGYF